MQNQAIISASKQLILADKKQILTVCFRSQLQQKRPEQQRWKGQFETRAGWCDTFCPLSFIFLVQWCSKACRVHPPNSVPSVPPIPIPRTQSHTEICSANQRRWRLPWRHTAVLLVLHWMTVTSYDEPSFFNGNRSGCACVCVCVWCFGWGLRLMGSNGILWCCRGFTEEGRWADGSVGGGGSH